MAESLTRVKIEKFVSAGPPAGKSEAVLWDNAVTGLGLRVRTTGWTAWVFVYRPRGAGRKEPARRVTLGSWPTLSIDAARAAARAKAGEVALGSDPAAALRDERNRERRVMSAALDAFEAGLERRQIVNIQTTLSTLRRGLAPHMNREIGTLTRAEFVAQIDAWAAAGRPGAAADLRKHSRSLLEWAVSRGLAPYNVLAGLRLPRASRAERLENETKGRALTDGETRRCGPRRWPWGRSAPSRAWACSPGYGARSSAA
jgi:hypothetical protein